MKTLKNLTILIAILSSVLFYVSCADKTAMEITLSYYAGNWYNDENGNILFTITSDGSFKDENNKEFSSSAITRNSATNYNLPDNSVLIFTSANKGTFTAQGNEETTKITKK